MSNPWQERLVRRLNYSTPARTAADLENYQFAARRAMELEKIAERTEKAADWKAAADGQRKAASLAEKAGLRGTADAHKGDAHACDENARRLSEH